MRPTLMAAALAVTNLLQALAGERPGAVYDTSAG